MKPSYATIGLYNALSAADYIGVGFEYKGKIFLAFMPQFSRCYCYVDRQATSHGKNKTIRFRVSVKQAGRLAKNALPIANAVEMDDAPNKGERFEQLVCKLYGKEWERSHTPFTKAGDIEISGEQVQLKYQGATIATYKQLKKYSKGL